MSMPKIKTYITAAHTVKTDTYQVLEVDRTGNVIDIRFSGLSQKAADKVSKKLGGMAHNEITLNKLID